MFQKKSKKSKLIDITKYQVFILTSPASFPANFAIHPWIILNEKGKVTRYEVCHFKNKQNSYLHTNYQKPFQGIKKLTFSNQYFWKSKVIFETEGKDAIEIISFVNKNNIKYQFTSKYCFLGPNSNTYIQWIINNSPQINIKLSKRAIGKNYIL